MSNGLFAGLGEATRGHVSNPLAAGEYVVRIDQVQIFTSKTKGTTFFKTTATVLDVVDGKDYKPGASVDVFYKRGENVQVFLSNVKSFICGVLGVGEDDEASVDEAMAERVTGEEQAFQGLVVTVRGRQQASKSRMVKNESTGEMEPALYTVYDWDEAMEADDIRAAVDEKVIAEQFPDGLPGEDS